ncbi:MAG TPA: hypothetical protein DC058_15770 [Planctomycetaceae bacterium]|nr:hypothetical protein [Planctomycetaceae bacterium]
MIVSFSEEEFASGDELSEREVWFECGLSSFDVASNICEQVSVEVSDHDGGGLSSFGGGHLSDHLTECGDGVAGAVSFEQERNPGNGVSTFVECDVEQFVGFGAGAGVTVSDEDFDGIAYGLRFADGAEVGPGISEQVMFQEVKTGFAGGVSVGFTPGGFQGFGDIPQRRGLCDGQSEFAA